MFDQSVNQPVFLSIKNKVIYNYYKGKIIRARVFQQVSEAIVRH